MGLSAQEVYATWQGTPHETEFNKYASFAPGYPDPESGISSAPSWSWNPGGDTAFQNYLQQQARLDVMKAQNPGASSALIDTSKYSTASDLAAAVAQSQYDNWKSTYFPAMQAARGMTTYANPGIVASEVKKGMAAAGQTSANIAGQQDRMIGRYGMALTSEQRAATDTATGMARSLAEVDAANTVRRSLGDRDKSIMVGSGTNFTAKV